MSIHTLEKLKFRLIYFKSYEHVKAQIVPNGSIKRRIQLNFLFHKHTNTSCILRLNFGDCLN